MNYDLDLDKISNSYKHAFAAGWRNALRDASRLPHAVRHVRVPGPGGGHGLRDGELAFQRSLTLPAFVVWNEETDRLRVVEADGVRLVAGSFAVGYRGTGPSNVAKVVLGELLGGHVPSWWWGEFREQFISCADENLDWILTATEAYAWIADRH